jgi:serine/threonine protein kinase
VILTPAAPIVIDFGIASAADATSLTGTGMVLGSSGWMAPEQLAGTSVGPAADVFAWAATVAYAATGRPPFGVGRAEAVSYRVVHGDPDLDGVPDWLGPLLIAGLTKDPGRRPTVSDILQYLRHQVADAPTVADAVTRVWQFPTPPSASRSPRPRRVATLSAAAVLAVAGTVIAGSLVMTGDEDRAGAPPASAAAAASTTTPDATAAGSSSFPFTAAPATSATTTSAPPPSTVPATTARPPAPSPDIPQLAAEIDPASDEDVATVLDFIDAHQQQVVQLDLRFRDPSDERILQQAENEEPAYLYVRGSCDVDAQFCEGGFEMQIEDLTAVGDSTLHLEHGAWILSGRFAVQGTGVFQGIFSLTLRAVPIA